MAQKPSIFINPKFKNAHINPNFLQTSKTIHINPRFQGHLLAPAPPPLPPPMIQPPEPPVNKNAIIRNTRRTLIRAQAVVAAPKPLTIISPAQQQLIKISKNKLVTAAHLMKCQQKENEIIKNTTESIIKTKKLRRREKSENVYKLDRRHQDQSKRSVSKYSIRRINSNSPKKDKSVSNLINISGVLFKSSSRKLVKTELKIRGEKFILDESGMRMKRDSESSGFNLSRIDIGGVTYKASQSGAFERDNSHQVRSYLSSAKTRSISVLAHKLKKSNLICPIYRRIGKCLAYANGRCTKLHDQRYVIVCPKFIKGSCQNEKCLLSHNANLHKMPVCKYFLQGLCQKSRECLYLHKKLTDDTKLCGEFLRGYCPEGDKCNLLHDFPVVDKKKFSIVRKKSKKEVETHVETNRYYVDEAEPPTGHIPKRGKLDSLPSYIPLN